MATIFSQIISGDIPSYKIYEDAKTYAFLDIHPEARGHILAVPKIEVDKVYDLPEDYYSALMATVKKLCHRIESVYGVRALIKVIGVDVPHAHVHIIPFSENYENGKTLDLPAEELAKIATELAIKD